MSRVDRLTVLGSGVLGGQIAFHSAFKGKTVVVYDIADDAIERCQAAHDQYGAIYRSDLGATRTGRHDRRERLRAGSGGGQPQDSGRGPGLSAAFMRW